MIAPNSRIILLKTPMELDENNQLTFLNTTAQYEYFYGLPKIELDDATFQRKDSIVRFETNETTFTYDDILSYNYCMYQNTSYGNKWFYAFITKHIYINDGLTDIELKTDVYQTWCFDVNWKQSFIEREHLAKADDVVGANLQPENLETGEYVLNNITINTELQELCPVVSTNFEPITETDNKGIYSGNIYQGYGFYVVKSTLSTEYDESDQITAINDLMNWFASLGKSDSVLSLFMAPRKLAGWDVTQIWKVFSLTGSVKYAGYDDGYTIPYSFSDMTINKPTTINGYTPRNKKLLTFPYCYLNLNNNSGNISNYHYEDFSTSSIVFEINGVLCPGCSIRAIPKNYKNIEFNYTNGLNLGKYPICSWNNDVYINWLTQNAVNIPLSFASGILATGTGVATKNPISTASGMISIAQTIGSIYEHSLNPLQTEGNLNSGDINCANNRNTFTLEQMSIKSQFAQVIDDFFSMYGYKTNKVKLPNLNNRSNWNYIKTINANILGDIPQEDLQEYKQLFNNGITLWHDSSHYLDYSQNNN